MPEHFNPYHKWLGIPPEEQPANHYRLLGIPFGESDQEVIASAAVQRMNWLRKLQSGDTGADAKRLSKEIADAWACLLNPQRKREYDDQLRSQVVGLEANPRNECACRPVSVDASTQSSPYATDSGSEGLSGDFASTPPSYNIFSTYSPESPDGSASLVEPPLPTEGLYQGSMRPHRSPTRKKKRSSILPAVLSPLLGLAAGYVILCQLNPAADFLHFFDRNKPQKPSLQVKTIAPQKNAKISPISPQPPEPKEKTSAIKKTPAAPAPTQVVSSQPTNTDKVPQRIEEVRLAPPTNDELKQGLKIVAETYKPAFERAKTSDDKLLLAHKILSDAKETPDPPTKYAALQVAQKLTEQVEDIILALEIVAERAKHFDVDTYNEQLSILSRINFSRQILARMPEIIDLLESKWGDSLTAERYDFAAGLANFFAKAHKAIADSQADGTEKPTPQQTASLKSAQLFADVARNFEVLAKSPTDGQANTSVGRFLCFTQGSWDLGLSRLAKGHDETLRAIAKAEMLPSKTADQKVEVADSWMQFAVNDPENAVAVKKRALEWYQRALPRLSGVHRTRVENRINELSPLVEEVPKDGAPPDQSKGFSTAVELEQAANRCQTAKQALALYEAFLNNDTISDSEKASAKQRLVIWANRADKNYKRVGTKWVPSTPIGSGKRTSSQIRQPFQINAQSRWTEIKNVPLSRWTDIDGFCVNYDADRLAIFGGNFKEGGLEVLNLNSLRIIFSSPPYPVTSASFDFATKCLFCTCVDYKLKAFDLKSGRELLDCKLPNPDDNIESSVYSRCSWSQNGELAAYVTSNPRMIPLGGGGFQAAEYRNTVYVLESRTGTVVRAINRELGSCDTAILSNDGAWVAAGSAKLGCIFDVKTGNIVCELGAETGLRRRIFFSPTKSVCVSVTGRYTDFSGNATVGVYELPKGNKLFGFQTNKTVKMVNILPAENLFVVATEDGHFKFSDLRTGRTIIVLAASKGELVSAAFLPENRIATIFAQGPTSWKPGTERPKQRYELFIWKVES